MIRRALQLTYRAGRRIVVTVVGLTVLLFGLILIVTPGPAIVVIPLGLAILSLEFAWARAWLKKLRETISRKNAEARAESAETYRKSD